MKISSLCIIASAAMLLSSCAADRSQLSYFTNIQEVEAPAQGDYNIKIEPSDELFITVSSASPEATMIYNLPLANPAALESRKITTSPQQLTYIVDTTGDINFPILGKLHVAGMTIEQLQKYLTDEISKDVTDPTVTVDLVNFFVDVAGEVKLPGRYPVKSRRFSVLDALSSAGDMTEYGERASVLVIREIDGKRVHQVLDLNDASTLASPFFYLKQNDYVYVEPNKIRKENSKYNQNKGYKLSVISTVVSASSVVASLVIALAIK